MTADATLETMLAALITERGWAGAETHLDGLLQAPTRMAWSDWQTLKNRANVIRNRLENKSLQGAGKAR